MMLCSAVLLTAVFQQDSRPAMKSLAIVGARIETRPGAVIEKGTVLCRGGRIVAVGPSVSVPSGTEVVDGTGLFVYYGFVNFGTTKGLKEAAAKPRQTEVLDTSTDFATSMDTWSSAVRADLVSSDLYDPDDAVWKAERSAGFTNALVFPPTGIVRGLASFVNLDGRGRVSSSVQDRSAIAVSFNGIGGQYPGTMLGATAVVRQVFMDCGWYERSRNDYLEGKGPRPMSDPSTESLCQALEKRTPLLMEADTPGRIEVAVGIAKEFGLRPIVFGAKQGWKAAHLKDWAAAVKLDFSTEPAEEKKDEKNVVSEPEGKKQERQRVWLESVKNVQSLSMFALTTAGCKDNDTFFANLRRTIKEGLPRERALAGLNSMPYEILGLQRDYGEIAVGKAANLTVLSHDFVDKDSKVKFLVIDGVKIDPAKEPMKFSNVQNFFKEGGR